MSDVSAVTPHAPRRPLLPLTSSTPALRSSLSHSSVAGPADWVSHGDQDSVYGLDFQQNRHFFSCSSSSCFFLFANPSSAPFHTLGSKEASGTLCVRALHGSANGPLFPIELRRDADSLMSSVRPQRLLLPLEKGKVVLCGSTVLLSLGTRAIDAASSLRPHLAVRATEPRASAAHVRYSDRARCSDSAGNEGSVPPAAAGCRHGGDVG